MKQRSDTAVIRARMAAARADVEAARARLEQARQDLAEAEAAELVSRLKAVDWMVLEDLDCGGMLVRIVGWGLYAKMSRRFIDKPGLLTSGSSDRHIAVSNRTMDLLRRSGLAVWVEPLDSPHEMKITELGKRHVKSRYEERARLAA